LIAYLNPKIHGVITPKRDVESTGDLKGLQIHMIKSPKGIIYEFENLETIKPDLGATSYYNCKTKLSSNIICNGDVLARCYRYSRDDKFLRKGQRPVRNEN